MQCVTSVSVLLVLVVSCFAQEEPEYVVTEECWMDIRIVDMDGPGADYNGRIVVGLFGEAVPMTVLNFASLCRGYKANDAELFYGNTTIHRVVPDFVVQLGDVTSRDGSGGRSIYGERFDDENFKLSHKGPGMVAMANHGKDTNGSQFYITLVRARWLDNKHVVFGMIVRGFDVIETIAEVPSDAETAVPQLKVEVVGSGMNQVKKYTLSEDQIYGVEDV